MQPVCQCIEATMTDYDTEFLKHLVHVLKVYQLEIERDTPAIQEWFQLIANTSILAKLLRDELLETNLEIQTLPENAAKVLTAACAQFDASMADMGTHLATPALPAVITDFVESVEKRLHSMQQPAQTGIAGQGVNVNLWQ